MYQPLKFQDPEMRCPKGHRIPRNGEAYKVNGKDKVAIRPLLGCPECAAEFSKELPKDTKKQKTGRAGKEEDGQVSFLPDNPGMFIK